MVRLVVATENRDGIDAPLAQHFGRAPYFTVIDINNNEVESVRAMPNVSEHVGGTGSPHDYIIQLKPKALIVHGMGPRGIMAFESVGIQVLKANGNTVKEAIEAYKQGKLEGLTEACPDAHHHH